MGGGGDVGFATGGGVLTTFEEGCAGGFTFFGGGGVFGTCLVFAICFGGLAGDGVTDGLSFTGFATSVSFVG